MGALNQALGRRLARFLSKPRRRYEHLRLGDAEALARTLRVPDVLLVEGDSRISTAIQYLTQSTWSHAALYVGDHAQRYGRPADHVLLEVDLLEGVVTVPLSKYGELNTRICRPVGLTREDRRAIVDFALGHLGQKYDLKNVFDLMRYLLPTPPVPRRFRRSLLRFGSGDPTKAICSTLIAESFQRVRYPILPRYSCGEGEGLESDDVMLRRRHHTQFTPRDFDVSPFFAVVKPTLEGGFDYRKLRWLEEGEACLPRSSGGESDQLGTADEAGAEGVLGDEGEGELAPDQRGADGVARG